MRESINRGCAWVMVVFGILPLVLLVLSLFGLAASPKIPVVAFWTLISFFGVYVLFFKKPKESSSSPLLTLLIVLLLLTGLVIFAFLVVP